ncbi:MAG TPA: DUF4365 domain-containing protein [Rhizomicrobium sp.]|jgi:hypothetical protein|nr:DUF4365 domain-containing protein [Rhizomicrobium sp.]
MAEEKTITRQQVAGSQGEAFVRERANAMGFLYSPYGTPEAGIDGLIEIRDPISGLVSGQIVAVQVKTTDDGDYTAETATSFEYLMDPRDVGYWRGSKLPDILRLYSDEDFRKGVVRGIRNEVVKRFWEAEFEEYPARLRAEACAPIQNKLGALLADPTLYRILVEPKIDLSFRKIMDGGRMLLVNVAKGGLGEDSSLLLGSLVVSTLGLAAFSRAEHGPGSRRPFFVYLDEFHNFTTLMLANMMSELRKYGLGLVLAHQYLHQLEPDIRHAVLGNAGTLIAFRVGAEDAPLLVSEFQPKFETLDLLNLPNHAIYLKLMIDGSPSQPFSARTLAL